jgi:hypothetical protein
VRVCLFRHSRVTKQILRARVYKVPRYVNFSPGNLALKFLVSSQNLFKLNLLPRAFILGDGFVSSRFQGGAFKAFHVLEFNSFGFANMSDDEWN